MIRWKKGYWDLLACVAFPVFAVHDAATGGPELVVWLNIVATVLAVCSVAQRLP
jgi:hypothetical protein